MLRSMTGYGKASLHTKLGYFVVEIVSINRKFLDLQLHLPEELMRFEGEFRRWISSHIFRGRITLKLFATFEESTPIKIEPNIALARQIKEAWDKIADALKLNEKSSFNLNMLRDVEGILRYETALDNESHYLETLKQVVTEALMKLIERKCAEGKHLQEDIVSRLNQLERWILAIAEKSNKSSDRYREKLRSHLMELIPGQPIENEERILRELVIYADKVDITEEITRFQSHLKQFRHILESKSEDIGKQLEFLLQEMFRESGTMSAKTDEVEVSQNLILIKTELEKIREQIQNVE